LYSNHFVLSDKEFSILDSINSPTDLKELGPDDLIQLSRELREFIIDIVSSNPGHFGASLGVVELTVALHHVFNTPEDRIIWDVGHQAYGHKILTGRKGIFHTNRKYKGISGFPKPTESRYDAFGVGHASTSISAALGIALASQHLKHEDRQVVAVIGDGSLTGGLAFEGLNNAGSENSNLLVILNDNNIAIDPNVGAIKEYLIDITTSKTYNRFKKDIWNILGALSKLGPDAQRYAQRIEHGVKSMFLKQSNLFESLNFRYFGPVDGHDILHLTGILKDMKHIQGPKLLHVKTQKGKGFPQAEQNQTAFHSPGRFDKKTGQFLVSRETKRPPRYQDVFGHTLLELARKNEKIIGITPAMPTGSSLKIMMDEIPERTYDVGIAEQHAVTFSAGLAIEGMVPFCNIYSTFMQRSYDQVIHDVAMNEEDLRNLMYTAQHRNHGPFSIRYPRGRGVHLDWKKPFKEISVGKGKIIRKGTDIAILSIGNIGNLVVDAIDNLEAEHISAAHYDMRFVKPLDEELLHKVFKQFKHVITVEDGIISGGFGSAILEFMCDHGYTSRVKRLGVPDRFVEQGTQQELYEECGYDVEGIIKTVKTLVKPKVLSKVI